KGACFADRLSCHRFWANQFRLLLHAAAYWLLDMLRRALMAAGTARMQLDTLRLRVIKIGGWVREHLPRLQIFPLHLPSRHLPPSRRSGICPPLASTSVPNPGADWPQVVYETRATSAVAGRSYCPSAWRTVLWNSGGSRMPRASSPVSGQ